MGRQLLLVSCSMSALLTAGVLTHLLHVADNALD